LASSSQNVGPTPLLYAVPLRPLLSRGRITIASIITALTNRGMARLSWTAWLV